MTTLPKILSTIAAVGLTTGIFLDCHGVGNHPWLAGVLPLGAVAFGVSLVTYMLEKEMAKYDEEQAAKFQSAHSPAVPAEMPRSNSRPVHLRQKAA